MRGRDREERRFLAGNVILSSLLPSSSSLPLHQSSSPVDANTSKGSPLSNNKAFTMAARREIQPASSSDDDSQSSESAEDRRMTARMEAYDSDGSGSAEEHARPVRKFDDLPTDDSESDSDDDSDEDSNTEQDDSEESSDEDDQADTPLSERVASRALQGRRYHTENQDEYDGKRQRAQRKSRAIELASQRLRDAKKKSAKPNNNDGDDSSAEEEPKRKKSKHAPTEMSSKRRDFYSRKTDLNSSGIGVSIGANKYKPRDPRMVSLSGHLDADLFEKRYGFLDEVSFHGVALAVGCTWMVANFICMCI